MNLKQAQKFLKDNQVRYVLAQFVDIHGVAKTKSVPVSHFEDILTAGAGFAGFAVWGFGMGPHSADYLAVGDLDTLSLVPWQPGYARIVCDGRVSGKPYPYDSRLVLKNQVAAAAAKGWTVNVGIEPEFMLLKKLADGSIAPAGSLHTMDLMGNQLWHTDSIFLPVPALANILAARVLSTEGGETEFASTRTAWADLPASRKAALEGAVFRHQLSHSRKKLSAELAAQPHITQFSAQAWKSVWRNPVTGEDALYLASHTFAVDGLPQDEAEALIDELTAHATRPDNVYTHHWQPGDVLIWDARALLHRGRPWPYAQERTLASICVSATAADGLDTIRVAS